MRQALTAVASALLLASCGPALNTAARLNANAGATPPLSSPLLAGQSWEVEGGSVAVRSRMVFRVPEVFEVVPGVYSNLDRAGLSAAERGRPEAGMTLYPAVSMTRLSQNMDFFWSENGTDYRCRIERPSLDRPVLSGQLTVSGTPLGTCTARLLR